MLLAKEEDLHTKCWAIILLIITLLVEAKSAVIVCVRVCESVCVF